MSDQRFWRDASGRLTFGMFHVEARDYPAICRDVADALALAPDGELIIGLDQMFWDYQQSELAIGLDWDIWMGFMVVAKTKESEPLVHEIRTWLDSSEWNQKAEPEPAS